MHKEHRLPFYIAWHLVWGMLIIYGVGFAFLNAISLIEPQFELVHVWHVPFLLGGCILAIFSFLFHRMIQNWDTAISDWSTSWRLWLVAIVLMLVIWIVYLFFVFVPVLLECLLLLAIERAWDSRFTEKAKRKSHNEEQE